MDTPDESVDDDTVQVPRRRRSGSPQGNGTDLPAPGAGEADDLDDLDRTVVAARRRAAATPEPHSREEDADDTVIARRNRRIILPAGEEDDADDTVIADRNRRIILPGAPETRSRTSPVDEPAAGVEDSDEMPSLTDEEARGLGVATDETIVRRRRGARPAASVPARPAVADPAPAPGRRAASAGTPERAIYRPRPPEPARIERAPEPVRAPQPVPVPETPARPRRRRALLLAGALIVVVAALAVALALLLGLPAAP